LPPLSFENFTANKKFILRLNNLRSYTLERTEDYQKNQKVDKKESISEKN
jgi:hypothetical protein